MIFSLGNDNGVIYDCAFVLLLSELSYNWKLTLFYSQRIEANWTNSSNFSFKTSICLAQIAFNLERLKDRDLRQDLKQIYTQLLIARIAQFPLTWSKNDTGYLLRLHWLLLMQLTFEVQNIEYMDTYIYIKSKETRARAFTSSTDNSKTNDHFQWQSFPRIWKTIGFNNTDRHALFFVEHTITYL